MDNIGEEIKYIGIEAINKLVSKVKTIHEIYSFGHITSGEGVSEKNFKRLDVALPVTARDKATLDFEQFVEKYVETATDQIADRINSLEGKYDFVKINLDDRCVWCATEDDGMCILVSYGYNMRTMTSNICFSVILIKKEDII